MSLFCSLGRIFLQSTVFKVLKSLSMCRPKEWRLGSNNILSTALNDYSAENLNTLPGEWISACFITYLARNSRRPNVAKISKQSWTKSTIVDQWMIDDHCGKNHS
ncbi:hypothetical protein BDR07DRAFT_1403159 [Suillus spraguei]|nr:hypothetical protein BDR07DRAFT_1403159 [Suillus spraguei]